MTSVFTFIKLAFIGTPPSLLSPISIAVESQITKKKFNNFMQHLSLLTSVSQMKEGKKERKTPAHHYFFSKGCVFPRWDGCMQCRAVITELCSEQRPWQKPHSPPALIKPELSTSSELLCIPATLLCQRHGKSDKCVCVRACTREPEHVI